MDRATVERRLADWKEELNTATIYRALAGAEKNEKLAGLYIRLAETEERHGRRWADDLTGAGITLPRFRPSWRTKTLIWMSRHFGTEAILPVMSAAETRDSKGYLADAAQREVASEERSHALFLREISRTTPGGLEGGALAQIERRHRTGGGNALRAAVLGANDGLISNLNLVMGVSGAALNNQAILITGMAGLLAGASAMALGEWLSVKNSRELYERQIAVEKAEIAASPEEEIEELSLIYQTRGIPESDARAMAQRIMKDPANALDTLSREELGLDPGELGGSPLQAAYTSFGLFAVGAIIPVIPFIFLRGPAVIPASVGLSLLGMIAIGAGTSLFTGRTVLFSATRQVLFGMATAAVTFGIGHLLGVSLKG